MAKRLLLIVLQFVLFKYASCSPSVLTTETVISSGSDEFPAEILSSKASVKSEQQWNHRDPTVNYGVDVSWPMHHSRVSTNYPWLPHNVDPENNPVPEEYIGMPLQPLGNRQQVFDEFMQGCRNHSKERAHFCDEYERSRTDEGLAQPARMTNFTEMGFKKIRAPEALFKMLREFWEANKHLEKVEDWEPGNIITNNWESPSTMVAVEDETLIGGGMELRDRIWNTANDIIQEWTGQDSFPTSVYGVRVYKHGAILATHVDRLPLVSSMIINVDQDVDEDWPLEVIGHDGIAHNVSMSPGDIVLYESHSILHGRPFALKGRYYANIFVHFAPLVAIKDGLATNDDDLSDNLRVVESASDAAAYGKLSTLKEIAEKNISLLFLPDANGWQPIHEAARGGFLSVIEYLVEEGANINSLTGYGDTVLDIAAAGKRPDDEFLQKLQSLGAVSGPSKDLYESADDNDEDEIDDEEDEDESDEEDDDQRHDEL